MGVDGTGRPFAFPKPLPVDTGCGGVRGGVVDGGGVDGDRGTLEKDLSVVWRRAFLCGGVRLVGGMSSSVGGVVGLGRFPGRSKDEGKGSIPDRFDDAGSAAVNGSKDEFGMRGEEEGEESNNRKGIGGGFCRTGLALRSGGGVDVSSCEGKDGGRNDYSKISQDE